MSPKTIKYAKDSDDFYDVLKMRVDDYFQHNNLSRYGNQKIYRKALVLFPIYFLIYFSLFFIPSFWIASLSYVVLGLLMIILGINFGHDAVHHTISSNKKISKLFKYTFEIAGACSFAWEKRHVLGHHVYPNIRGNDPDTTKTGIVRVYKENKWYPVHRLQVFYIPVLYLFYSLNWTLVRDFKDVLTANGNNYVVLNRSRKVIWKFLLSKFLYLFAFFPALMIYSHFSNLQVVCGFFIMHFSASICLTVALVPSHITEHSLFPVADEEGKLATSWAKHQVLVSNDYATHNSLVTYLFGAFNHHIVHHLFPNICHVHYKALTPIVKETILAYGLPYNHEDSILKSYGSHFRYLLRLSRNPDV